MENNDLKNDILNLRDEINFRDVKMKTGRNKVARLEEDFIEIERREDDKLIIEAETIKKLFLKLSKGKEKEIEMFKCGTNDMIGKKILMDKDIQTQDASTNMPIDEIVLQRKVLDKKEHIESLEEEVLRQKQSSED
ncbi:hypothetical protein HHI36_013125 [Cryptolaemus montrouzieri]|uniref:Uncharacterized protein n=1 Tax=Cryptolaemus montrouzieri TaxID=559131 RepID=A0ABD2NGL1_9CUCU